MGLSNEDHVIRHIPLKKLLRDSQGNILGILPQAFELRPADNLKLSVKWVGYFNQEDLQANVKECVLSFRSDITRPIKKTANCGFGIGNVDKIKKVGVSCGVMKIDVVHSGNKNNPSHSSIIHLPDNDLELMEALAVEAFDNLVLNKNF